MGTRGTRTRTALPLSTLNTDRSVPPESAATRYVPPCDLVTVPARQGLEAVDILRLRNSVGPVLHDRSHTMLGFVVPQGTADGWDMPGSRCTCTAAERERAVCVDDPPVAGTGWLLPPREAVPYTDPAMLAAALGEAVVTLAAAERI